MEDGKISPASKDWALSLASQNPDSFNEFIRTSAPIVGKGETVDKKPENKSELSEVQKSVCSQMGLKEKDYIESLGK